MRFIFLEPSLRHSRRVPCPSLLLILALLTVACALSSCSPGHIGGNEIAFLRNGHLWTIDPNGANAFEVVSGDTPVIGYTWSPDHHLFAFRTLDTQFAKTPAAQHLNPDSITGAIGDVPSNLNTIGIDGGSPIPILSSSPDVQHSNAWWNITGNRLLYREESTSSLPNPGTVLWWISQNDQPEGIARKLLPSSFSIPSLTSDIAIGSSQQGIFTTTLAGTNRRYIVPGPLPGHPLSAPLERVLWQPAHQHPAMLYAIAPSTPSTQSQVMVQLLLHTMDSRFTSIATCTCTQFAWSPDGNYILYSTGRNYIVSNLDGGIVLTISGAGGSVPYWSPDSRFLLLDGPHTLTLVTIATRQQQVLLDDTAPAGPETAPEQADVNTLLQPASNSPWASDSRHFLFLTRERLNWQGRHLKSGRGLYIVAIDNQGQIQSIPTVVDTGNDSQAGWTYENPNTSFLF